MGKAKPTTLGDLTFRTQRETLQFFKAMLAKYRPDEWVSEADSSLLVELLHRHPDTAEKTGNGIHHFEVMRAEFNTKCFAVVRRDGTRVDFSYKTCITSKSSGEER
jgi:hypothetical protein